MGFWNNDFLNLNFALQNDVKAKRSSLSCPSSPLTEAAAAAEEEEAEASRVCPDLPEEVLEWISDKDAFPSVDTCPDIFPDDLEFILNSPVSVLDNTTLDEILKAPRSIPSRPRSKIRRRKRTTGLCKTPSQLLRTSNHASMGRRCSHCLADKTPQWRAGPMGPKTLCNACGVRYKSGRLVPEYRPANSPTFSSVLHSNSHKKVVELRRKKYAEVSEASRDIWYDAE